MKDTLTHFNSAGEAHMVDVGDKSMTHRVAVVTGRILMQQTTFDMIMQQTHKKGDVLGIARIAAIMASKQTAQMIPLCHPVPLTHVSIEFEPGDNQHDNRHNPDTADSIKPMASLVCIARTETRDRTGVEMEALQAVSTALLTIYDMCKAVDRGMQITDIGLQHKSGGQSGTYNAESGQI